LALHTLRERGPPVVSQAKGDDFYCHTGVEFEVKLVLAFITVVVLLVGQTVGYARHRELDTFPFGVKEKIFLADFAFFSRFWGQAVCDADFLADVAESLGGGPE
jgi:hypothetical protein